MPFKNQQNLTPVDASEESQKRTELISELSRLGGDLERLQDTLAQYENKSSELVQIEKKIKEISTELVIARRELKETREITTIEKNTATAVLLSLNENIAQAKDVLEAVEKRIVACTRKITALEDAHLKALGDVEAANRLFHADKEQQEKITVGLSKKINELTGVLIEKENEAQALQLEIVELLTSANVIRAEHTDVLLAYDALKNDVARVTREITTLQESLKSKQREFDAMVTLRTTELNVREEALNVREGDLSRREVRLADKEQRLLAAKEQLEKHFNKDINVII